MRDAAAKIPTPVGDDPSPHAARRRRRRWIVALATLLVTVLVVGLAAHSDFARRWALQRALEAIGEQGIRGRADALDWNLLRLRFRVTGLELAAGPADAAPFFAAEQLDVDLPFSVLRGKLAIESLRVTGGRVRLQRDSAGNWALPVSGAQRPAADRPWSLPIDRLEIDGLDLEVEDVGAGFAARLSGVDVTLGPTADGTAGGLAVASGQVQWPEGELPIDALGAHLRYDGRKLVFEDLFLATPWLRLDGSGTIADLWSGGAVELRSSFDADLAGLLGLAAVEASAAGSLRGTSVVRGAWTSPSIEWQLEGDGLTAADLPEMDLAAGGTLVGNELDISSLDIRAGDARVSASGRLRTDSLAGELRADWRRIDLTRLLDGLLDPALPRPSAIVEGELEASWQEPSYESLAVRGAVDVRAAVANPQGVPLEGRIELRRTVGADAVVELTGEADRLVRLEGSVRMRHSGDQRPGDAPAFEIDGSGRLESADLARSLTRLAELRLIEPLDDGLVPRGALVVDWRARGPVAAPRIDLDLSAPRLALAGIAVDRAEATLTLGKTRVELGRLLLRSADDTLTAEGRVRDDDGSIDLRFEAAVADIERLAAAVATSLPPVSGPLTLTGRVTGNLGEPRLAARISGGPIALADQSIDRIEGRIELGADALIVEHLELERDDGGRIVGAGAAAWDPANLRFDLEVERFPLMRPVIANDRPPLDLGARASGHIQLGFDATGLAIDGTLSLADTTIGEMQLGLVEMTAETVDTGVYLEAALPRLAARVTAELDNVHPRRVDATLGIDALELVRLRELLPMANAFPIDGLLSATIDVGGNLEDTRSWSALVQLQRLDAAIDDTPLVLRRPGRIEYRQDLVRADIDIGVGAASLLVDGTLLDGQGEVAASLRGDLADLDDLVAFGRAIQDATREPSAREEAAPLPLQGSGPFELTASLRGDLADPDVAARLAIRDARLAIGELPPVTDIDVDLDLEDRLLTLGTLEARWLDARLAAEGSAPLALLSPPRADDSGPATLDVRVDGLTLSGAAPLLGDDVAQRGDGRVSARASLRAEAATIEAVSGEVVLEEATLTAAGVTLEQRLPSRIGIADGRVDVLDGSWSGAAGDFEVRGSATFVGSPGYDLSVDGDLDLRTLNLLLPPGMSSTGRVRWSARLTSGDAVPVLDGRLELDDAELRIDEPGIIVTDLDGAVDFRPGRIAVEEVRGIANGGPVTLTGELTYGEGGLSGGELRLTGTDVALEIPDGLRTLVDLDLGLRPAERPMVLRGQVTVQRGSYRRRMSLTSGALEALSRGTVAGSDAGGPLGDLRLDLRVVTDDDLLVDNNLARLRLGADLRLAGTAHRPTLSGRAELAEGGQVFLGGNTYTIEAGSIDFIDPTAIVPDVTLTAVTMVSNYEITLNASGTPDAFETELSSDPPLDRSDLVSVLVTGRTLDQAGGMQTQVAREQVAGFLTGELSASAGRAIGLDSVRLERSVAEGPDRFDPALVATETDPSMRLTLSKRVRPDLELIFSQSLRDAGGFTWIVSYRVLRDVELRAVSLDDNDRSYEFSHDLRFGGGAPDPRSGAPSPRVGSVTIGGDPGFAEGELRRQLRLGPGDRFDIFRWQDDRERLERWYHQRGFYEARVRTRRQQAGSPPTLELTYEIRRGPATRIEIEGHPLPDRAITTMQQVWQRSIVEEFLVDELERVARQALLTDDYLAPTVEVAIDAADDGSAKVARVRVETGERASRRRIVVRGDHGIADAVLQSYLRTREVEQGAWLDPPAFEAGLEEYLRQLGYLDATVQAGTPTAEGDEVLLPVTIDGGSRYHIGALDIDGVERRDAREVAREAGLEIGDPYAPGELRRAARAIEAGYRAQGFAGARVEHASEPGRDGEVAVSIRVHEGARQVVEHLEISGATRTRESLVRNRLGIAVGTPVDLRALYLARRRLYQTGVFRRVDITVDPVASTAVVPADATPAADGIESVAVHVSLQERPRFRFRYGLALLDQRHLAGDSVNRDLDVGVSSEFADRNLFGRALTAGVSARYDPDNQVVRGYLSSPSFVGLPLTSTVYLTRSRERFRADAIIPLLADRASLTLEQRFRIRDLVGVAYSYSFETNHTFEEDLDPDDPFALDITAHIARLTLGALIDTRDDLFDATRGWSHSSSLEHSLRPLGSDLSFVKYLAQQTYFHPFGADVVLASAARLGLATAFDEELIPSERFYAGGGNSVRGYPEDSLGPTDFFFGDPTGGNALVVLKQEVRFPLRWRFRGVAFFDAGNVFERVSDISLTDLKTSWGLGLRIDTPIVLLRFDYGFRIGREPGEPLGRFFFSIGQAF